MRLCVRRCAECWGDSWERVGWARCWGAPHPPVSDRGRTWLCASRGLCCWSHVAASWGRLGMKDAPPPTSCPSQAPSLAINSGSKRFASVVCSPLRGVTATPRNLQRRRLRLRSGVTPPQSHLCGLKTVTGSQQKVEAVSPLPSSGLSLGLTSTNAINGAAVTGAGRSHEQPRAGPAQEMPREPTDS